MGAKPCVDAIQVEGVGTDGEGADVIVVLEFEQANSAVAARVVVGVVCCCGEGVEGEGDGFDDGVVEAVRGEGLVDIVGGVEGGRVVREREGVEVAGGGRE